MMKNYLFAILCVFLSACGGTQTKNKKVSVQSLEAKQASGVVLIKNTYYYSIDFDSNLTVYFTGIDDEGNVQGVTFDEKEVKPVTCYGTGFFVSKDGLIATNAHVACPTFSTKDVRSAIVDAFNNISDRVKDAVNQQTERLGELRLLIDAGNSEYMSQYQELAQKRDNNQKLVNAINRINSAECDYSRHSDIGVAFNNTHIRNTNDFTDCVTVTTDEEYDLALIQLKTKETPKKVFVFDMSMSKTSKRSKRNGDDEENKRKKRASSFAGKTLYMIGFNLGPQLGLTKEGLKAQITKGEVSQNTDEDKIMYTIPSLHGSSGSPVLDSQGKVVAVNFAGLDKTQNFNFGIKVNHLVELLQTIE